MFKMLKGKKISSDKNPLVGKLPLKEREKERKRNKTFLNRQELREFITTKPAKNAQGASSLRYAGG